MIILTYNHILILKRYVCSDCSNAMHRNKMSRWGEYEDEYTFQETPERQGEEWKTVSTSNTKTVIKSGGLPNCTKCQKPCYDTFLEAFENDEYIPVCNACKTCNDFNVLASFQLQCHLCRSKEKLMISHLGGTTWKILCTNCVKKKQRLVEKKSVLAANRNVIYGQNSTKKPSEKEKNQISITANRFVFPDLLDE